MPDEGVSLARPHVAYDGNCTTKVDPLASRLVRAVQD